MIYHDRVTVVMSVPFDPPQEDPLGNEILDEINQEVPAEVWPLDTTDVISQNAEIVTSRYKMILAPTVNIPPRIGTDLKLGWGPFPYDEDDSQSGLRVDGAVESHYVRGRLHHYELITASIMG